MEVKHLSTGSEYPDSPCGSGDHKNFVYDLSEVTCPKCKRELFEAALTTLDILNLKGEGKP